MSGGVPTCETLPAASLRSACVPWRLSSKKEAARDSRKDICVLDIIVSPRICGEERHLIAFFFNCLVPH